MTAERRAHERLSHPLEGSWRGASGATRCRISDISLSGCFPQSLAMPKVGETTEVTIEFGPNQALTLTGDVAYAEQGMGFAVKFVDLDEDSRTALEEHVAGLKGDA